MTESRSKSTAAERGKPQTADYRALANFRYALRQFLAFSGDAAQSVGLTPQQHQAMLSIIGAPEGQAVTIGFVAKRMLLKHHSMVELVDRLVELNLVARQQDAADRRKVLLSLTPKAKRLLTRLSAAHLQELRQIRPVFADLLERLDK
ncbi:MarR family winged helix-turn-helix transcriptional regulator [Dongia sedimenti]|uniref:MarR family transcriptional regulator n=1 Tax=Dongia sedimenti TaxID=3064282 RepID=A0ABU0YLZ2_9PROT|nr:MarR family transcriptional regulator [Rhodospirillaceae bacterium R-7]